MNHWEWECCSCTIQVLHNHPPSSPWQGCRDFNLAENCPLCPSCYHICYHIQYIYRYPRVALLEKMAVGHLWLCLSDQTCKVTYHFYLLIRHTWKKLNRRNIFQLTAEKARCFVGAVCWTLPRYDEWCRTTRLEAILVWIADMMDRRTIHILYCRSGSFCVVFGSL